MGIKWNDRIKFTVLVLLLTFGVTGVASGLLQGDRYWKGDYFDTAQFDEQLNSYIHYLGPQLLDREQLKKSINVTEDEIKEYRTRYGTLAEQIASIKDQYNSKISEAKEADSQKLADAYIAERDEKIADITKNFESDEYVRQKIIKEKEAEIDRYFSDLKKFSDGRRFESSFQYYLKNTETGEIYTDTDLEEMTSVDKRFNDKEMAYFHYFSDLSNDETIYFDDTEEIKRLIDENADNFQGYIGVPKKEWNQILGDRYHYKVQQIAYLVYTIGGLIALLFSWILYKKFNAVAIRTDQWQRYFNRLPVDLATLAFLVVGFWLVFLLLDGLGIDYIHEPIIYTVGDIVLYDLLPKAILLAITFLLGKMLFNRMRDRTKLSEDWKGSIVVRCYDALQSAFLNRKTGTQLVLLLIVIFCWGVGTFLILPMPFLLIVYIPASFLIGIPVLILLFKRVGYFNQIAHHVKMVANGHLEKDLPVKGKSVFADLARDLNELKHGVKVSQNEQAKSERLKTELITNVSHDLRTPLTSIITYTELLKQQGVTDEDRDSYIEIIDRKSKRLKVLIDDLFEASKMASGNIELVKERVDIVQLLQQALAEYSEAVNESSLQLRITNPDQPVFAVVDGQQLWRVFDNLIGNILKYSLENTRVYIGVKMAGERAVISFKNVSKYELSENIDELFERFKRGDESRHTDGSGLGLAIAKSIVDLHDGGLDIEVDGDLFKVTVTLQTAA